MGQLQYCRDFQQDFLNAGGKETARTNPGCLMYPNNKNKQTKRLHKENHTEFLQHKANKKP